jgi:MYXO-CTERM domain-containing protein
MGCEVEQLQPGRVVTIVGFGATSAIELPDGEVDTSGSGKKRFTQQTITDVIPEFNDVIMIGPNTGGCFGDSGGPAMIQLTDGTWRVLGAASTLHPDFAPDPNGELCGLGTVYEIAFNKVDWLEQFSQHDLTPCHAVDGSWDPSAGCGGFPFFPGQAETTWIDACTSTQVGTWSGTCGPPFSTGPFPDPNPTPNPPDPPPDPPPPPPDPPPADPTTPTDPGDPTSGGETETETETDSDSETAGMDEDEKGCGCRSEDPGPLGFAVFGLLALRRRRR